MTATAENLRDLHSLHQRARALRDRLASGPKTLAARQAALNQRQTDLEKARKALQNAKLQVQKLEHTLKGQQARRDDLRTKLNTVRKNEEYKAIQNQIALETAAIDKTEEAILEEYEQIDAHSRTLRETEQEVQAVAQQVAALQERIATESAAQKTQLQELERAIAEAETIIPADQRDRYQRVLKQHGAEAMAAVENRACTGCYVSVTAQTMNDLINCDTLVFCKSCGRILYLADEELAQARRSL